MQPNYSQHPRSFYTAFGAFLLLLLLTWPALAGVKYQTTQDWGTGFNGQITVSNEGKSALNNWQLAFDFPVSLSSIWDAKIVSHTGTRYVIKGADWNASIPAGGQISFGFGGAPGNLKSGPTNFVLNGAPVVTPTPTPTSRPTATSTPTPQPSPTPKAKPTATPVVTPTPINSSVRAILTQSGSWNGGFGATLDVFNDGAQPIDGWTLKFDFAPQIDSLWNGDWTHTSHTHSVTNLSWNRTIAPGAKISLGFSATGELSPQSISNVTLNGATCPTSVVLGTSTPSNPSAQGIVIGRDVDASGEALQITIPRGVSTFPLSLGGGKAGAFSVATNNPKVVAVRVLNGATLEITGLQAGRAGLRLEEVGGAKRFVGVRVQNADGSLPGWPSHLAIGSVSEDTDDHLNFWHDFGAGATNRYVDARYIYLNGGAQYGWSTWTNVPGDRAARYIRESKKMGMLPIFVWYNIPDGGESYTTDTEHIGDAAYMKSYFKLLQLFLDVVKRESPDEPVGVILEPDFLGYLAQNAGKPASQIPALTSAAYDAGILTGADPQFPNTVQGLVQSINYILSKQTSQISFGWQMNLWASPAGGWTTPISGKGLMHLSDTQDINSARAKISAEASAITRYYVEAGITSNGADFVSIDKYGLDAASAEAAAAQDPQNSTWFWNADQWTNYLVFVRAMHDTTKLPVWLWQLPVGHINSSQMGNPYTNKLFPDLQNANRQGEDSAPTFFFGDDFRTSGARFDFFAQNRGADSSNYTSSGTIHWNEHLSAASSAGVSVALFGAGVGASTSNVGSPPSDSMWWIVKAQKYLDHPASAGGH